MKMNDIQMGEQYEVSFYGCGTVLEKGVSRILGRGKERRDGVRVQIAAGDGYYAGKEMVVSSREVKATWAEAEAARQERERERRLATEDRNRVLAKTEQVLGALSEAGVAVERSWVSYPHRSDENPYTQLAFEEQGLERLLEVLGSPQIRRAANAAPQGALAEALG